MQTLLTVDLPEDVGDSDFFKALLVTMVLVVLVALAVMGLMLTILLKVIPEDWGDFTLLSSVFGRSNFPFPT